MAACRTAPDGLSHHHRGRDAQRQQGTPRHGRIVGGLAGNSRHARADNAAVHMKLLPMEDNAATLAKA